MIEASPLPVYRQDRGWWESGPRQCGILVRHAVASMAEAAAVENREKVYFASGDALVPAQEACGVYHFSHIFHYAYAHLISGTGTAGVARLLHLLFLLSCLFLAACGSERTEVYEPAFSDAPPGGAKTLIFGIHPFYNHHRLFQVYQPLVDHLNRNLAGVRLRLEASRNYADFERKLAARHFHLALPNPYQTIASRQYGYQIFGKMGDDDNFRGLIVVRKDSGIEQPRDLKGKPVSYPAPTALAATMLPQWFFHEAGIDVRRDLFNLYVGSQESAIMSVYLGKAVAGATWPPPWRAFLREHPDMAAQLEVRWQTPPLVNNGLVARNDILPGTIRRIRDLLLALPQTPEGRAILAPMELSRFEAADDRSYQPVVDFLARFERQVRLAQEQ